MVRSFSDSIPPPPPFGDAESPLLITANLVTFGIKEEETTFDRRLFWTTQVKLVFKMTGIWCFSRIVTIKLFLSGRGGVDWHSFVDYINSIERPGIKFSDADLIGIPIQIIVGKNFVDSKKIEVKTRRNLSEDTISSENIIEFLKQMDI